MLNVGCGFSKYYSPNVVNLDGEDICKPQVIWDLNITPLPFKNNMFDMIIANHILEHLKNWWNCFNEFTRILVPGGLLVVYVPGGGGDSQLGYRDHVSMINDFSFFGVSGVTNHGGNAWAETEAKRERPCSKMKMIEKDLVIINDWWIKYAPRKIKTWMLKHLRNVIVEEGFFFRKLTP